MARNGGPGERVPRGLIRRFERAGDVTVRGQEDRHVGEHVADADRLDVRREGTVGGVRGERERLAGRQLGQVLEQSGNGGRRANQMVLVAGSALRSRNPCGLRRAARRSGLSIVRGIRAPLEMLPLLPRFARFRRAFSVAFRCSVPSALDLAQNPPALLVHRGALCGEHLPVLLPVLQLRPLVIHPGERHPRLDVLL